VDIKRHTSDMYDICEKKQTVAAVNTDDWTRYIAHKNIGLLVRYGIGATRFPSSEKGCKTNMM